MGHRANFILRTENELLLTYSHWAANTVGSDFFWGPVQAERFIRAQDPTTEWLDSAWCEGGAYVDTVERRICLFGGEDLAYDVVRRSVWFALSGYLWPGWERQWAGEGVLDLARLAGRSTEDLRYEGKSQIDNPSLLPTRLDQLWCHTVVTLDGQHFTLANDGEDLVTLGPDLIRRLRALKTLPLLDESPPQSGMEISTAERSLRFWQASSSTRMERRAIRAWSGWRVFRDDSRAIAHLAELAFFEPEPEDQILESLAQSLLRTSVSPVVGVLSFLQQVESQGHTVEVNPLALRDAQEELSVQERQGLLAQALRSYRADGRSEFCRRRQSGQEKR